MAAAIPATNKWLLTKQASVALSGLWDDRHGAERRPGDGVGEGVWTLDHCFARGFSRGLDGDQRAAMSPWWKGVDTPPRSRPESVNRRRMRAGGGQEEGGASGMARWVQLHGVSWVQWASCPLFFHLWALCQIQSTWLSSYGNQLTALSPSSSLSDSITNTPPPLPLSPSLSHSLSISLVAAQSRPPLILLAKSQNGLQRAFILSLQSLCPLNTVSVTRSAFSAYNRTLLQNDDKDAMQNVFPNKEFSDVLLCIISSDNTCYHICTIALYRWKKNQHFP